MLPVTYMPSAEKYFRKLRDKQLKSVYKTDKIGPADMSWNGVIHVPVSISVGFSALWQSFDMENDTRYRKFTQDINL